MNSALIIKLPMVDKLFLLDLLDAVNSVVYFDFCFVSGEYVVFCGFAVSDGLLLDADKSFAIVLVLLLVVTG